MGIYHDYVAQGMSSDALERERRAQLARIGTLRNSVVLTYAARISPLPAGVSAPVMVLHEDLLPFSDLIDRLTGDRVSVVIETFGGAGEVGRQMVEMLHQRFNHVEFIVPGFAMSTGTIMALGGHEIIMGPESTLGPIDAQLIQDGKQFSADALLEGFNAIKAEVLKTGQLNPAYIPLLQRISPGELQHAQHALEFARETVTEWLAIYKFDRWNVRRSTGAPVTPEYRRARAREIAEELSSQAKWRSHGRSIRLADLQALRLQIIDYSAAPHIDLADAIRRYYALLRIALDSGNLFKVFETSSGAVFGRRFGVVANPQQPPSGGGSPTPIVPPPAPSQPVAPQPVGDLILIQATCPSCKLQTIVQLNFAPEAPQQPGAIPFPSDGNLSCPRCNSTVSLGAARAEIEKTLGRTANVP